MLLTRASEYALLTLDFIQNADKPKGAEQLATELNFPKSFLAKILQSLAKNGILESKKGAHGGFIMAKKPSQITVSEIILAAEGKAPAIFDCSQYINTCPNGAIGTCNISPFLTNFQHKIDTFLQELTLEDILK
ncbi:Rrf2 family transcriptional regulator [Sulfurovum sp. bin170]|uniref:Rrf2 family transcriptional regulator n=1 Tax=Sulfurovum sp. bin170 TaxID=2695268 RepID=UPI0013DE823A|nr:Rrf2 family transcriptional regulator [Sulfurovum sp. bin170]NEW61690.1 Rrf2 family transcriptional regulator [Sulfurovum sp. bin170]